MRRLKLVFAQNVSLEIGSLGSSVMANGALERFLAGVRSYVLAPIPSVEEGFRTYTTSVKRSSQMVLSLVA